MWDTVPVIITSIIEINIGIIVGCVPHLAPMMRNVYSTLVRTCGHIKTIVTERVSLWGRSRSGNTSPTENPAGSDSGQKRAPGAYLETRILGGVDGKGKFLQSGTLQPKSWWQTGVRRDCRDGEISTACYSEV